MRFTLEQLTAFVAVVDKGSFSKAARYLGRDRATIHQHVGNLEIDLGLTLFNRDKKLPVPTAEAKRLMRHAKQIIFKAQLLEATCDSVVRNEEQEINIYYDCSISTELLGRVHNQVSTQYPNTQLHWTHSNYANSVKALESQKCDIAVTLNQGRTLPATGVDFFHLGDAKFTFYCHASNSLAQREQISMADLEREVQYVLKNMLDTHTGRQAKISTNISVVSHLDLILSLLKHGGWAILPCNIMNQPEIKRAYQQLQPDFFIKQGHFSYSLLSKNYLVDNPVSECIKQCIVKEFTNLN